MLVTLQSVLTKAQRGHYAVGAFNVSDLEQIQAVISAAVKMKSPVIVNVSEKALAYAGIHNIALIVRDMAKHASVPVVLNLDHGHTLTTVKSCLRHGFTGIMYDGSSSSDRSNFLKTKSAVQLARPYGIGVEGEIGRVKFPEDGVGKSTMVYTDPMLAAKFVSTTKICALAVAIGNAHGLPIPDEKLDFTLLNNIRRTVKVPLVLHGASGTPGPKIKQAIKLGIAKINIDTDLRLAFSQAIKNTLRKNKSIYDPRTILSSARQADENVVIKKIILFGSRNRA